MKTQFHIGATGRLVELLPEGQERDGLLKLVRIGSKFTRQQIGKRPGQLAQIIFECVKRTVPPCTRKKLLAELELEAARRARKRGQSRGIEKVDYIGEKVLLVTKTGRQEIKFITIGWHLTQAKRKLKFEV